MSGLRRGSSDKSDAHNEDDALYSEVRKSRRPSGAPQQLKYGDCPDQSLLDLHQTPSLDKLPVVKLLARQKQIQQEPSHKKLLSPDLNANHSHLLTRPPSQIQGHTFRQKSGNPFLPALSLDPKPGGPFLPTQPFDQRPGHSFQQGQPLDQRPQHSHRPALPHDQRPEHFHRPALSHDQKPEHSHRPALPHDQRPEHSYRPALPHDQRPEHSYRPALPHDQRPEHSHRPALPHDQRPEHSHRPALPHDQRPEHSYRPALPHDQRPEHSHRPALPHDQRPEHSHRPALPHDQRTEHSYRPALPHDQRPEHSYRPAEPLGQRLGHSIKPALPHDLRPEYSYRPAQPHDQRSEHSYKPAQPIDQRPGHTYKPALPYDQRFEHSYRPALPHDLRPGKSYLPSATLDQRPGYSYIPAPPHDQRPGKFYQPEPPLDQTQNITHSKRKATQKDIATLVAEHERALSQCLDDNSKHSGTSAGQVHSDINQDFQTAAYGGHVPKPPPGIKNTNYSRHIGLGATKEVLETRGKSRRCNKVRNPQVKYHDEVDREQLAVREEEARLEKARELEFFQHREEADHKCEEELRKTKEQFNCRTLHDQLKKDRAKELNRIHQEEELKNHREQSYLKLEKEKEEVRRKNEDAWVAKQKRNRHVEQTKEANKKQRLEFRSNKLEEEKVELFQRERAKRIFNQQNAENQQTIREERKRLVEEQIDCERELLFVKEFEEAKDRNTKLHSELDEQLEKIAVEEERKRKLDLNLEKERQEVFHREGKSYTIQDKNHQEPEHPLFEDNHSRLVEVSELLKPKKPSRIDAGYLPTQEEQIAEKERRRLVEQTTYYEENLKTGRSLPKVNTLVGNSTRLLQSRAREGRRVGFKVQTEGGEFKTQKITGKVNATPSYGMKKACGFKSQKPIAEEVEASTSSVSSVSWIPEYDTTKKPECKPRYVPYAKFKSQENWADSDEKKQWLKDDFYPQVKEAYKDRPRLVDETNIQDAKDWYKKYRAKIRRGDFT